MERETGTTSASALRFYLLTVLAAMALAGLLWILDAALDSVYSTQSLYEELRSLRPHEFVLRSLLLVTAGLIALDTVFLWHERKRVEEDLERSETRYHVLFEASPVGIFLWTLDGEILECNAAAGEMLGYTPDEMVGMNARDLVSEDISTRMDDFIAQEVEHGGAFTETKVKPKDGRVFPAEVSTTLISLNGRTLAIAYMLDISERKAAEEALRAHEELLRAMFESVSECILVWDKDLICLQANRASVDYLGIPHEKLVGKSLEEGLHRLPHFVERWKTHIEKVLEERTLLHIEEAIPLRGRLVYSESTFAPVRNSAGEVFAVALVYRDVTARRQTERALAMERERLAVTLRSIGDGVIATDIHGLIVLMNPVAETLTGWTEGKALGHKLEEVFVALARNDSSVPTFPELLSGTTIQERRLFSRKGTERLVAVTYSPIQEPGGKVIGAVLVCRDITEQRKMAQEKERLARLESLSVIAGGIAHDFRNYLGTILTHLSLAETMLQEKDIHLAPLDFAQEAVHNASELTQQLLTFAKGGYPLFQQVSLADILLHEVEMVCRGRDITYVFDIENDLWPVKGDVSQLRQVIFNLTLNAVKAMPQGGKLTWRAHNLTLTKMESLPLPPGHYVKLVVEDTGKGIAEEDLPFIFDPFFSKSEEGAGLGLAVVHSVIQQHGGHVMVETTSFTGTIFAIYLPAASDSTETALEAPVGILCESPAHYLAARIMLMDDDDAFRQAIEMALTHLGYEVIGVADGHAAVETYHRAMKDGRPFDAVILDLTVRSGMGGKEAAQAILELDPDAALIVSSGYNDDPILTDYQRYGFHAGISKPFTLQELAYLLERLLGER